MRLDEKTPARIALSEYLKPMQRPVGRPAMTWMKQIETDLSVANVQLNLKATPTDIITTLITITENRNTWSIIRVAMDGTHPEVLH